MPWFDWSGGSWFLFPMLMCAVMMIFMMGSHRMSGHHMGGHYWRGDRDVPSSDPALDTLRQRFASGELTAEEYEERKKTLTA